MPTLFLLVDIVEPKVHADKLLAPSPYASRVSAFGSKSSAFGSIRSVGSKVSHRLSHAKPTLQVSPVLGDKSK